MSEYPRPVEGPCLNRTFNAALMGAGAGTFFAACQLAWYPDPPMASSSSSAATTGGTTGGGAVVKRFNINTGTSTAAAATNTNMLSGGGSGIATTTGKSVMRTIARPAFWMAGASAAFGATECLAESLRNKKDPWNASMGGMAAGLVIGATTKRADFMVSTGLGLALFMFALDFAGGTDVHDSVKMELRHRMYGTLPKKHRESEALASLKEKYPECKEL